MIPILSGHKRNINDVIGIIRVNEYKQLVGEFVKGMELTALEMSKQLTIGFTILESIIGDDGIQRVKRFRVLELSVERGYAVTKSHLQPVQASSEI